MSKLPNMMQRKWQNKAWDGAALPAALSLCTDKYHPSCPWVQRGPKERWGPSLGGVFLLNQGIRVSFVFFVSKFQSLNFHYCGISMSRHYLKKKVLSHVPRWHKKTYSAVPLPLKFLDGRLCAPSVLASPSAWQNTWHKWMNEWMNEQMLWASMFTL